MSTLILAMEGRKWLVGFLLLDVVAYQAIGPLSLWVLIPLTAIVCLWFLENRPILKSAPLSLLAPAAGFVTSTRRIRDPWLDRDSLCVDIRLSAGNSLYSITEGKLCEDWARTVDGMHCYTVWIQTDEKDDVVVEIGSRLSLRKQLRFYPQTGDRVGQGDRIGFLYLPGRIRVYAPSSAKCLTEPEHSLIAGKPIAELAQPAVATRSIMEPVEG